MQNFSAIVLGATGATGKELLISLLNDSDYNSVVVFSRETPKERHKKLKTHLIDFSKIESYKELIQGDILFSCLGTTLNAAGSKDKQFQVDYTYQYKFAKLASENGVKTYSLVSSVGAKSNSPFFYLRMKGQLEESIKKLEFEIIQIFQPPSLIRQEELLRAGEKITIRILKGLNSIGFMKSQKPLSVSVLAKKMIIEAKKHQVIKVKTFKNQEIFNLM